MTVISTTIKLPLTEEQAQAIAAAALAFGVDSWEMGVHILSFPKLGEIQRKRMAGVSPHGQATEGH